VGFIVLSTIPRPILRRYFKAITSPQKRNKVAAAKFLFNVEPP
jgi:hypothetical protein